MRVGLAGVRGGCSARLLGATHCMYVTRMRVLHVPSDAFLNEVFVKERTVVSPIFQPVASNCKSPVSVFAIKHKDPIAWFAGVCVCVCVCAIKAAFILF